MKKFYVIWWKCRLIYIYIQRESFNFVLKWLLLLHILKCPFYHTHMQMQIDKDSRSIYCMYRHPKEGGVPSVERRITANPEAERCHIETIVNFMCSFMWASIIDSTPPQPQLNLL